MIMGRETSLECIYATWNKKKMKQNTEAFIITVCGLNAVTSSNHAVNSEAYQLQLPFVLLCCRIHYVFGVLICLAIRQQATAVLGHHFLLHAWAEKPHRSISAFLITLQVSDYYYNQAKIVQFVWDLSSLSVTLLEWLAKMFMGSKCLLAMINKYSVSNIDSEVWSQEKNIYLSLNQNKLKVMLEFSLSIMDA